MLRSEFETELKRLAEGFGVLILKPKADAFWLRFKHCHLADVERAVTDALLEPRFPSGKGLSDLIERQLSARRRLDHAKRESLAQALYLTGEMPAMTPLAKFYGKAIPRCHQAPKGQFAATMADLLATWIAEDAVARDVYLPEAQSWYQLAEERAAGIPATITPSVTELGPPPGFGLTAYRCDRISCEGGEQGCGLAPNACGPHAGWRTPSRAYSRSLLEKISPQEPASTNPDPPPAPRFESQAAPESHISQSLNPSQNQAVTAKVTEILNEKSSKNPEGEWDDPAF